MNIAKMSVQASVIMEKDINASQFPKLINRLEGRVLITRETSQDVSIIKTITDKLRKSGVIQDILDKSNMYVKHVPENPKKLFCSHFALGPQNSGHDFVGRKHVTQSLIHGHHVVIYLIQYLDR